MAAVLGFAGVQFDGEVLRLNPALPGPWQSVELPVILRGGLFRLRISRNDVAVTAAADNREPLAISAFGGGCVSCLPGAKLRLLNSAAASEQERNGQGKFIREERK